jgi:D-alanyl-lipoteichoic acid acyltransferase DltB (MBOAT superfamily)
VVDYFCGLAIHTRNNAKRYLYISLFFNLALLGVFKYFNFFVENIQAFLTQVDLHPDIVFLNIVLPVGISFYTFQTMSYTIDIYRKKLPPPGIS